MALLKELVEGKNDVGSTLDRILTLISIIPKAGEGASVVELTDALANEGYSVTTRTVQRDLLVIMKRLPVRPSTTGKFDGTPKYRWVR